MRVQGRSIPKYNLTITNTPFRQADKDKTTWMHPLSKQRHLNDYAICCPQRHPWRQNHRSDAEGDVEGGAGGGGGGGAECWTDHRLVRSVLLLHITPKRHKTEILQASFWHCKTEAAGTQSHVCEGPRRQADCPRTTVWTPILTVGTVHDWWRSRPSWPMGQRRKSIRTGSMKTTST